VERGICPTAALYLLQLELSATCDVIGHVTIGLAIGSFL